jgi:hypothetical protein
MEAPFYSVVSVASAVTALLGSGANIRLYPDEAPQGTQPPYAVYTHIVGIPQSQLVGAPGIDAHTVQVDCYSKTRDQALQLAGAIRAAVETRGDLTLRGMTRDPQTRLYNYQFDIEWLTPR